MYIEKKNKMQVTQSPTLEMLTSKTNKKHIQNNRLDERNHSHVNKETNKHIVTHPNSHDFDTN